MVWRLKVLISIFALSVSLLQAETPADLFLAGNKAMETEKYEDAAKDYEALLSQGLEHPDLYYNLGNAYYKLGYIGKAVWAYEKGRQFAPRDADINYNLELVNARVADRIEMPETIFLVQWYRQFKHLFTLGDLLTMGSGLLVLAGLFFLLRYRWPNKSAWFMSVTIIIFILSLGVHAVALDKYWDITDLKEAVIVDPEVQAYSAPLERAETVQFKIHEGTKVEVTQTQPGWREIILLDGKKGWIRTKSVFML